MKKTVKKIEVLQLKPLQFYQAVNLGADPEFFFSKKGQVVGSEKVLPTDGLYQDPYRAQRAAGIMAALTTEQLATRSRFVIDGVQAELNPDPSTCRALFGNEIARCFRQLKSEIMKKHTDLDVDFSPLVKLSQEELDSLSEASKIFGCAPSTNVYSTGKDKTSKIEVDPKKYLSRSAGGHIHLGNAYHIYLNKDGTPKYNDDKAFLGASQIAIRTEKALKGDVETMVKILDIVVGNTCVLIDRDPSNAERRKNYGSAGEHRCKSYGVEYRTLSNFWLRSYQLMSFVTGMCRHAVLLVDQSVPENNYVKAILDAVDIDDVVKAINTNDFKLAYANFKKIEPILLKSTAGDFSHESSPIHNKTIKNFHYFVSRGINHWFKENPINHWNKLPDGHGRGFEAFLQNKVAEEIRELKIDLNDLKYATVNDPGSAKPHRVRAVRAEVAA